MRQGRIPTSPGQFGNLFPDHLRRGLLGLGVVAVLAAAALFFQDDDEDRARPTGGSVVVEVDRVVDGDTAKVLYGGRSEYVRYIGVDTPESVKPDSPVECFGEEAKRFNAELLARNPEVRLVFDRERRDRYGRLLAYVYSGPTLINAELLRRGYATTLVVRPNDRMADRFAGLEAEARDSGRGLWSAC